MYKIKQLPEDFIVKEMSNVKLENDGQYVYFLLVKKNLSTLDAIKKIAQILHIKEKQIGFAGSKDKQAVTEQVCSIKGVSKNKLTKLEINNIKIKVLGSGKIPISLGDLKGNNFEIVIRDLEEEKIEKIEFIENYFDQQRFSKNNIQIGRHLVKKEFKEAVERVDYYACQESIKTNKTDYVGALRKVPLRLLRLYVNAYQSYLWNETLALYLEKQKINKKVNYEQGNFIFTKNPEKFLQLDVPLLGFSEVKVDPEIQQIITNLMDKENINHTNFIIKQIPELSLEGEMRKAVIKVADVSIGNKVIDELNENKKKVKVKFSLPKGSYATLVIRRIVLYQREK